MLTLFECAISQKVQPRSRDYADARFFARQKGNSGGSFQLPSWNLDPGRCPGLSLELPLRGGGNAVRHPGVGSTLNVNSASPFHPHQHHVPINDASPFHPRTAYSRFTRANGAFRPHQRPRPRLSTPTAWPRLPMPIPHSVSFILISRPHSSVPTAYFRFIRANGAFEVSLGQRPGCWKSTKCSPERAAFLGCLLGRPFRARCQWHWYPGRCPGLASCCPFGASVNRCNGRGASISRRKG